MSEAAFLDLLRPSTRVYLSAGSAEPLALAPLLSNHADRLNGVDIIGSFVPGVNDTDYAALHPGARMTTLLLPSAARDSFKAGRVSILPLSYFGFAQHLRRYPPDIAVVQVAPPDADGNCSLGPAADFAPLVWHKARHRIAFINRSLPQAPGSWRVRRSEIDVAIECDGPVPGLAPAKASTTAAAIARNAARMVEDGATLQVGLGGAPAAILASLTDRHKLSIHSGMIGDEIVPLADAGALAPAGHCTGIAIGSEALYDWLPQAVGFDFVPTPQTHGPLALAQRDRLIAINSALEVDLLGQANLEWRHGKLVSGAGGAPNFLTGAHLSPGGLAIIALPSTARDISRIIPRITAPTVSLGKNLIDVVVTEHGVAHIGDLPMEQRAQALIGISAPEKRADLQQQWEKLRNSF